MKLFYHLDLIILSWLCICHPTLGHNRTNKIQCIDSEREALLQFKHGVTTDYCGLLNTSWERHIDCCQWRGVVCSNLTSHVVKLNLVGSDLDHPCLEGKVSPSLGELKHLEHLDLSYNNFSGEIPHQLGNLSKLATLDLHDAYSFVPVQSLSWISRLTLLRYLDLSYADLSEIRNWIAIINNLPSLHVLSLDSCQLSMEIPSSISYVNSSATLQNVTLSRNFFKDSSLLNWLFNFSRITTQLIHLDISWNAFQVPFPREIGNLHSLSYLDLSFNNFKGLIPSEIGNLHSLLYLDLSSNNFKGLIPSEIGNLYTLSYLDLSYNAIQGNVFKIISQLCNLEQLHLGNNTFTDELSNVIHSLVNCNNKALLVLDLSFNCFRGEIPDDIGSLSSLTELNLGSNQLKGEINKGISQLSMLETLDISSNSLEGNLTHTFFLSLARLRELILSDNPRLVISIEEDWIPPFKLDVIQLRSCRLGPRFPKWLQLQTNVSRQYIDVSNTFISDSIPVSFWNSLSSNLVYLNMSYNQLYGMLPNLPQLRKPFISNSFESEIIDLSSNLFEGVVPSGFATTTYLFLNDNRFSNCFNILCPKTESMLENLDLSNNLFSGELPDCWMNFSYLTSLHLENNRFSGSMPKSINTLSSLEYLHLYNNSFSGPFPLAFESLTSLVILNLGYNSFSGNIPSWIGTAFQSLHALILRENHFIGEIPKSICQLNSSQILDLANNHLSGVLPHCISNFTLMTGIKNLKVFELDNELEYISSYGSETRIDTVIVSWKREEQRFKGTIKFVKYIDLSGNKLSGEIPDGISSLTSLGALDLSENKLSGNIPFEIGNLKALEFLNLSNNHLTGRIPVSLAKVTTLDVVDVSNNNLSGEIPVSTQLQSFDASSYAGNPGLCGTPLPSCSKDRAPSNLPSGDKNSVRNKDNDFDFFLGLYISVVLGFIVGFWGVFGTLIIKTSWRHAYFRLLDNIKDRIM